MAVTSAFTSRTPASAARRLCQLCQQDFEIDAHPDGDQENAEAEPAKRRGDDLDFAAIIGLGDHDPRDQCAEDRARSRRADVTRLATITTSRQARGTAPDFWCAPPARTGAAAASRPRNSMATADTPPISIVRAGIRPRPRRPAAPLPRAGRRSAPAPGPRTAALPALPGRLGCACRRAAARARSRTGPARGRDRLTAATALPRPIAGRAR